ncbi:ABC transporter ATP-binding protein [Clostridium gasigenes]|nr:ABC transporter ATP-binding protein [Clostridium gasigenes]
MMLRSKGVNIKDITKIYVTPNGKEFKAVDNVSIEIKAGEFVTLLGPSGCGKTTTLRMIAGFEVSNEGEIYIGGDMVNNDTPDKRDTAMVFQSYALFPHLNIFDNISYGLKLKKMGKDDIKLKAKEIIDLVGLAGMESRYPNQLSGGQQQRVALARALVMEPGVLLFDEPLSNLDAKLRVQMRSEIRNIQQKVGITAIYVTHDQSEAMSLSDRIIIMNKGIIEQVGTPKEIYYSPATEFVADFIGEANFIGGEIVEVNGGKAKVSVLDKFINTKYSGKKVAGDVCKIVLRPESIIIGDDGNFEGKVISSTFMGAYQDYRIKIKENIISCQDFNPIVKKVYNIGDRITIDFNEENVHII